MMGTGRVRKNGKGGIENQGNEITQESGGERLMERDKKNRLI